MNFPEWEPRYKQILDDFGYIRKKDEEASNILATLLEPSKTLGIQELSKNIENKRVTIFGSGPTLETDLKYGDFDGVKIAADGATSAMLKHELVPDYIVTDLDGHIPDQIEANKLGSKIIVHAHGDNIEALKEWVPKFHGNILGTTQAIPNELKGVYNFGGFTDGDRAVYLSAHFKAKLITLVAFNFKSIGNYSFKYDKETKLRKLTWANLLIGMVLEPQVVFYSNSK
jgi:uncharacterized Rossmann fold enzyme